MTLITSRLRRCASDAGGVSLLQKVHKFFLVTLDTQEILHGMQVLIRHGDRGALFDVKEASHSNCPYEETYDHPELLHSYYDLSSSLKSLDADKHDFRLVPEKTGCINGQLTSKGVMQHLQLGSAVRQRLGKVAADWITDDTEVYSTFYPRTYQSALVSGLCRKVFLVQ